MSRAGLVVLACIGLMAMGCDDRGSDDAGPIMVDVDSGTGSDAGPGGNDAGPGGGMCTVTGLMPLPMACTPRCANATLGQVNACMDATCVQTTLAADTTAPIDLMGPGGTVSLDCEGCFFWQRDTCVNESCPTEYQAFVMCNPMTDPMMCMPQLTAVNACIMAMNAAVNACLTPRATQCFSTTMGGFFPELGRPLELQVDVGQLMSIAPRFEYPL